MPNRILKESICTCEKLVGLTWFEEVCFARILVNVDDYGHLDARPRVLVARLFPLRRDVGEQEVAGALRALAGAGLVAFYEEDGLPYLALCGWEGHQKLRYRKKLYPFPGEGARREKAGLAGGGLGLGGSGLPTPGVGLVTGDAGASGSAGAVDAGLAGGVEAGTGAVGNDREAGPDDGHRTDVAGFTCAMSGDLAAGAPGHCGPDEATEAGQGLGGLGGAADSPTQAGAGARGIEDEVEAEAETDETEKQREQGDTHTAPAMLAVVNGCQKQGARARLFAPPRVEEVAEYVRRRGYAVDAGRFVDFYASKGWMVGTSPMRDWRAAVNIWESNRRADEAAAGRCGGGRRAKGGPGRAAGGNPFEEAGL